MKDYSHLLNRPEHVFPEDKFNAALTGKRVLVTGAGGSIGSAIFRRLYASPAAFVGGVGHSEAPIFQLKNSLPDHPDRLDFAVIDVGDEASMEPLLENWRPDIVIHAAAHKHVGLMESQPREAFQNNTEATLKLAELAMKSSTVRKFVFISTDKAAKPTCVMGASKRLAEAGLLFRAAPFASVCRFGNVLGSAGSLVEIIEQKLESKGIFVVRNPKMRRYFITAKEAVGLVLTVALLEPKGSLFTLDMGPTVSVMDIIEKMTIRQPLDLQFTADGSGEKVVEDLINEGETLGQKEGGVVSIGFVPKPQVEAALNRVRAWAPGIVREAAEL